MMMTKWKNEEAQVIHEEAIPEGLHFLLALLNTRYGQQKRLHDAWPDRAAMERWLREQGLITAEVVVAEGEYRRAIDLREALRQSLRRSSHDASTSAEALETLNHIARYTLLKVHFTGPTQARLVPESGGVDGVLARALGDVYTAMWTGLWARLKVCQNDACGKAFYDGSKNHAGVWCSTRTCGNRMHARTYRQQKKQSGRS
jgi:predicted RNA-binding Zn ribbon-like protein